MIAAVLSASVALLALSATAGAAEGNQLEAPAPTEPIETAELVGAPDAVEATEPDLAVISVEPDLAVISVEPGPESSPHPEPQPQPEPESEGESEFEFAAPIVDAACWMGHNRPVYVVRNQDRDRGLRYQWSAPGAGKRGWLGPRGSGNDASWFVGTGQFPSPTNVWLDYELGGKAGTLKAPDLDAAYCTYSVSPVVRWLDAAGDDVMPSADDVAGWWLELDGPLATLRCTWNGAGLACDSVAKQSAPLAPGTFHSFGPHTELRVPAFGDTSFTVRASDDPPGFRLVGGTGRIELPDVGDGLDQSNVDTRASAFFPARLQQGSASHVVHVALESVAVAPGEVRGTVISRPDEAIATPSTTPPRPNTVADAPAPPFTLPETGGSPAGLVGLGLALVVVGFAASKAAASRARATAAPPTGCDIRR